MKRLLDSRLFNPLERMVHSRLRRSTDKRDQILIDQLQNATPLSVLQELDMELRPLLENAANSFADKLFAEYATEAPQGNHVWQRSNFARYMAVNIADEELLTACTPFLWHVFAAAAHYPFQFSTITKTSKNPQSQDDARLDRLAFRRAFAFLVLRGWELFPPLTDGYGSRFPAGKPERRYSDKVPRLAQAIFRCLSGPSAHASTEPGSEQKATRYANIQQTLQFVQPSRPRTPTILGAQLKSKRFTQDLSGATSRLLQAEDECASATQDLAWSIEKSDLQTLLQLLLLVDLDNKRWFNGLSPRTGVQQTGDVRHAHLNSSRAEISRASEIADNLIASCFEGRESSVLQSAFQDWTQRYPYFIFGFCQLWASLFTPKTSTPTQPRLERSLSTSIMNLACLTNSAFFLSGDGPSFPRHWNEMSFYQDLQSAELVGDLATQPQIGARGLLTTFMTENKGLFMLIIRGRDLKSLGSTAATQETVLTAFVNCFPKSPLRTDQSRRERDEWVAYTWRNSFVQSGPSFAVNECGGSGARLIADTEELELFSHGMVDGHGTSIVIDFGNMTVGVSGLETRLSLTGLQCFRIPGDTTSWTYNRPTPLPWGGALGDDPTKAG